MERKVLKGDKAEKEPLVYPGTQETKVRQEQVGQKELRGLRVHVVPRVPLGNKGLKAIQVKLENQEKMASQVRREVLGSRVTRERWVDKVLQVNKA